ncbi:hypothetical protein CEXT_758351 [Caerostris extrusa]|uniref:Uncharacterized protein n=1 Tax=Caerostris extrusa TaxID=172846 RepID=A0AAV4Y9P2_CAEEX|nr:hypothetical protein CEXT_758351 [Caerostris extrusa]
MWLSIKKLCGPCPSKLWLSIKAIRHYQNCPKMKRVIVHKNFTIKIFHKERFFLLALSKLWLSIKKLIRHYQNGCPSKLIRHYQMIHSVVHGILFEVRLSSTKGRKKGLCIKKPYQKLSFCLAL